MRNSSENSRISALAATASASAPAAQLEVGAQRPDGRVELRERDAEVVGHVGPVRSRSPRQT